MRLKLLFIAVALFVGVGSYGQIISWDFTSGNTPNVNLPAGTAVLSFNTGGLNATTGCTGNGFSTNGWNVNEYLQIVAPTTGYEITTMTFNIKCSDTGPLNFKVQYSSTGTSGTFTDLSIFASTNSSTCASKTVDFTAINVLDNNANTVIRLVFTGGEADGSPATGDAGSTGTFRIDDLIINGAVVSTDAVDYANVQFPGTGNITVGGTFNIYAQTYEPGVTEAAGAGVGIVSWIGYSSSNTDPSSSGWNWISTTFNAQSGNNDEFVADLGTVLPAGTYYYASRFQLNGGPYKYGGFSGGFWDGTTNVNGTLTVNPHLVDWANLQSPTSGTINIGNSFFVYAQVYEQSVTEPVGQGAGITSWIGYSTTNTNPNTWTNWIPATYNSLCSFCAANDDEYMADIGTALPVGTYYYASRFQLNGGPFKYGGFSSGFWNGTTNVNGTLTINPHLVDWANLQFPPTAAIVQGSTFTAYGQVYEPGVTNISASQGTGITVDFGISPVNSNTNPNTWTNWTSTTAIYNNSCGTSTCGDKDNNFIPDNDEYSATTGSALTIGTYYYTFRYSLNGGPYMYGGYNGGGGGFWSGTDVSGVLTVSSPPACITEGFSTGTTAPSGWTFNGIGSGSTYTTSGNYGASSPSLQFDATGDKLETPTVTNAQELRFWLKGQGTDNVSALLVEGYNGAIWVTIDNITNSIPTIAATKIYNSGTTPSLPTNIEKFRFTYTKNAGNLAFDDVVVTCGPPIVAEMNIKGNGVSIVDGDSSPNTSDSTDFGSTIVGNTIVKTFTIENTGVDPLTLTGASPYIVIAGANPSDFSISIVPVSPIAASTGATTFEVTFQPSAAGSRTATLSITNNDNDENPYNFSIRGDGTICTPSVSIASITPASGPTGTQVTINGTGFSSASTVKFGAITASFVVASNTIITAIVPNGATNGNITITDIGSCKLSYSSFTVISSEKTTCASSSTAVNELFISEVTDASTGSLTYVEVYNATASNIDMTGYKIRFVNNGTVTVDIPLTTILAPGDTFTLATSVGAAQCSGSAGGDGTKADQNNVHSGVNNNDCIHLLKGTSIIDTWGVTDGSAWINALGLGSGGYDFQRKSSAPSLPSPSFNSADWTIVDFDACNDNYIKIESYEGIRIPPKVKNHPSYATSCKIATSLTVEGEEGVIGGVSLTYLWLFSAPGDTDWTAIASDGGIYTGAATATLNISNISGVLNYQYYCQIRENTNTCYTATNAIKITDGGTTIWNGTVLGWTNGPPSIDKLAIINADYNTAVAGLGSFSACSVVVNTGATLTITADEYVKIQNDLANNGVVTIKNDGSLVQVNDSGINTGIIRYERITPEIWRTDYTYWSSPVAGYTLGGVSQNKTLWDKYYSYDPTIVDWKQESSATVMSAGIGYIIRGDETDPFQNPFDAFFIGVPNNGVYSIPNVIADRSYLLGNPYPSALDADTFLTDNAGVLDGTLYFWTHNTPLGIGVSDPGTGLYAYSGDDYASYNFTGGTGTGTSALSDPDHSNLVGSIYVDEGLKPSGKIASGQGFFASSLVGIPINSEIKFNNSMRVGVVDILEEDNTQFFKTRNTKEKTTKTIEKHRIWLNLSNTQGAFKQTLVGYITNATNEYDSRFDGESFDANEFVDFYSLNQDKNLVIQGRALPFNDNDEVPLGFRTTIEGPFTINIDQVDGVLTNQAVFIEDKLTNTVFDLKTGNYNFNTVAGTFNERFILRYTNKTLGNKDFESLENQVLVSNKNKQIKVNSAVETIDKVVVYDLLGRQLFKKEKVNSNELSLTNLVSSQQTLLVKVSLQNGQTVTKKIIY